MRRRALLTSFGAGIAGVAGCSGVRLGTLEDRADPPRSGKRVSLRSVDGVPAHVPFGLSPEIVRGAITDTETARISVTATNAAGESVWSTARIQAFDAFVTEAGPRSDRLLLLKPSQAYTTVRAGCWRAALSDRERNHAYTNVVADRRYDPGDERTTRFDIYGHPDNSRPCVPPGHYRIESPYQLFDEADATSPDWEFTWGFTIVVETG